MAQSKVSVVIPCYKQAHFLPQAVESVLAQTLSDAEIIVIDDGSPDDTGAVAAQYHEVRYLHQENQGVAAARNAGMDLANGQYIVFLDADDYLYKDALKIGTKLLDEHPHTAMVSGRAESIWSESGAKVVHPKEVLEKEHYKVLLVSSFIQHPAAAMFRSSVLRAGIRFNETYSLCEDHAIYLDVARQFPVLCHGEVVSFYRRHPQSVSQGAERMLPALMSVLESQQPFVEGKPELTTTWKEGIRRYRGLYGERCLRQLAKAIQSGDDEKAMGILSVLWQHYFLEDTQPKNRSYPLIR